jgi:hypothetical protein
MGIGSCLYGLAFTSSSIHQLLGETDMHGLALVFTNCGDEPAEGERLLSTAVDLNGNLIVCATDSLGANLDGRSDPIARHIEDFEARGGTFERFLRKAAFDLIEGSIDDSSRGGLVATLHQ